jgi:iron-sulfur cluster assembly accessory protein
MLEGITIDFVDSLQGSGFKFDNPNAKTTCDCGQSFSV